MIVYRELSSLQTDLGISLKALYSVSNSIGRHYHKKTLPKANGEKRILFVPSEQLKHIQRRINNVLLSREEISPYATAYRYDCGPAVNAAVHVGKPVLLKLDIRHFFDNIIYPQVKKYAFPESVYSEQVRILLAMLCTYKGVLPQGAPASPTISNLILRDFDNTVGQWCRQRKIAYTRYCDDMTFSGDFAPDEVIRLVKDELFRYGFFLNEKKTKVLRSGQRKTVTGYVVNEKLNVSAEYKRKLRQEMHYCMKFGVASHLEHINAEISQEKYIASLLGRVNYVLAADSCSTEFLSYRNWLANIQGDFVPKVKADSRSEKNKAKDANPNVVHIPYFGKVDISKCPTDLNLDGMDEYLFSDKGALKQFVENNFFIFSKLGKKYAVCCGENSLAAVVFIVDGIFRPQFFQSAKNMMCEEGGFWHAVSEETLGNDIRKGFPPFYTGIIRLLQEYKLVYTNISKDYTARSAIVIPNYDKLIEGWLPRSCRKEVLQRGNGFIAGEKNGIILECLYGAQLYDNDEEIAIGRIIDYKNGVFNVQNSDGIISTLPIERCEEYSVTSESNPDYDYFLECCLFSVEEIEEQTEYDRLGIGKENSGLAMRNYGSSVLLYEME